MKTLLIPYITIGGHYDFGIDVYNDKTDNIGISVIYSQHGVHVEKYSPSVNSKEHEKWLVSKHVIGGDYQIYITFTDNDVYLSAFLLDDRGSTTYVPFYEVPTQPGN